jgi:hypothetical protein
MKAEELKQKRIIEFIRSNKTTESARLEMLQGYVDEYAQQITKEKDLEIEVLNQALKKIAGI